MNKANVSGRSLVGRSFPFPVPRSLFPLALLLALLSGSALQLAAQAVDPALEHAKRLLASTILIDGHNDLPWAIRTFKDAPRDVDSLRSAHSPGRDDRPGAARGR